MSLKALSPLAPSLSASSNKVRYPATSPLHSHEVVIRTNENTPQVYYHFPPQMQTPTHSRSLQIEKDTEPVLYSGHSLMRDHTPSLRKPFFRYRSHILTLDEAPHVHTGFRRNNLDMEGDSLDPSCERKNHDEPCRPLVEQIYGYHQSRPHPRLFMAPYRIQIRRPDLPARQIFPFGCTQSSSNPSARVLSQAARSLCSFSHASGSLLSV